MKTLNFFSFLVFIFFISQVALAHEKPEIQLANVYRENVDVSKYLVSEKLDGVRAYWDGKNLISRNGNKINAPDWFVADFPNEVIEGELWIGRQKFEEILSIAQKEIPQNDQWREVKFMLFDAPKHSGKFFERWQFLQNLAEKSQSPYLQAIEQKPIADNQTLQNLLLEVTKNGGEGLMLHKIDAPYKSERNDDLLKLKTYQDEEAVVISYEAGKGNFKGLMGAIVVENKDKIRFKIGSGFSIEQRKNPPKIGATITYKFYGKTKDNKPRFASFLRERKDI